MSEIVDRVKEINIFPIKSCHAATVCGLEPEWLNVGPTGFEAFGVADREYLLYDRAEGAMVTQRGWAAGSQKPKFKQDSRLATARINISPYHMSVRVPDFGILDMRTDIIDGNSETIQIFGNDLSVIDQGEEPARFFSRVLERDIRLMRTDFTQERLLPPRYRRPGAANQVAGADGMPFLLASQASLDWQHQVNGLELGTVPMARYRPNVVIGGYAIGAFMEDRVEHFKLGDMGAEVVKACARCPIPNIDQDTGERGGEAGGLAVLRGRAGVADDGITKGVFFGQNLNHVWGCNLTVGIGDPVTVLSVADRPNLQLRAA